MKFEDLDVKLIAIVFIVSFFLLIAGQQVYKKYGIDRPLMEDIKQKNYIKNVEIEKFNDQVNIKIELNKVDSFKETYEDLKKTIQKYLKNKPYRITIINKKGELSNIYEEKIRFIIYEAQKTGEYVKMKDSIDELSTKENFYVKIEFDEDMNLYLTMEKNNEVFYQVLFEK